MFIGVAGLIGVGKTTLTQSLADHLNYKTCFEPVEENPYLVDFYKNMSRWTFPMQMYLLSKRFAQHQEVIWDPCHREGSGIIQDRTIYEDTIFANMHKKSGLMDSRDYDTYISHYNVMKKFLQYPDMIIYLRISPQVALDRINERYRNCETGITLKYLQDLYDGYESFIENISQFCVVLKLDWSVYQPINEIAYKVKQGCIYNRNFIRNTTRI